MRNNHRNFNICHFFPIIMQEPLLNPFKLEPNSWHHKSMVLTLEILIPAGNIGIHEDIGVQMTYFRMSFPFIPSAFLYGSFFEEFRNFEEKWSEKKEKISRFISKLTSY